MRNPFLELTDDEIIWSDFTVITEALRTVEHYNLVMQNEPLIDPDLST